MLIKGADHILTMDDDRRELQNADIRMSGGEIVEIGQGLEARAGEEVHLASGCVVTPGLVNTHHHLYQTLTRAVPGGQDALLFGWLKTLYPIWSPFGPEEMQVTSISQKPIPVTATILNKVKISFADRSEIKVKKSLNFAPQAMPSFSTNAIPNHDNILTGSSTNAKCVLI